MLGRAKFRTKKELNGLVRELNPLPRVADCIEPLGPAPLRTLRNPTWEQFVAAFSPRVRELPAGERPRDWVGNVDGDGAARNDPLPVGPVPKDLPPVTGPQHYQVQFTTVEEHAKMVERAKALLARERPGVTLGELHLEAMKLLVASLEKRKFAVGVRPKKRGEAEAARQHGDAEMSGSEVSSRPRQRGETASGEAVAAPCQRGETELGECEAVAVAPECVGFSPRRTRHIPASQRREVFLWDAGRCTYVDTRGERCCETHYLELHHLQPFAKGGANVAANLTLRCAVHNALAAETDFGARLASERRNATKHEVLSIQLRNNMQM